MRKKFGYQQDFTIDEQTGINQEIFQYIRKMQEEKERMEEEQLISEAQAMKNQQTRLITLGISSLMKNKLHSDAQGYLNENITVDKENRENAKKGLLYLINKFSGGTSCPEIKKYFENLKTMELNKLKQEYEKAEVRKANKRADDKRKKKKFNKMQDSHSDLLKYADNDDVKMNIDQNYHPTFEKGGKANINRIDENVRFKKFTDDANGEDLKEYFNRRDGGGYNPFKTKKQRKNKGVKNTIQSPAMPNEQPNNSQAGVPTTTEFHL